MVDFRTHQRSVRCEPALAALHPLLAVSRGQQQKVAVTDEIALTDTAAAFGKAAIEEERSGRRYVGMTRARDLPYCALQPQALGPLTDTLDAIVAAARAGRGDAAAAKRQGERRAALDAGASRCARRRSWRRALAPTASPPVIRRAAATAPRQASKARDGRAGVGRWACLIGERIAVAGDAGPLCTRHGDPRHHCAVLHRPSRARSPRARSSRSSIASTSPAGAAAAVLRQITAFRLDRTAGPVPAPMPSSRAVRNARRPILNGRIDPLLETATGWSADRPQVQPSPAERWETLAAAHGPYLSSYAQALEKATARRAGGVAVPAGGRRWVSLGGWLMQGASAGLASRSAAPSLRTAASAMA